MDGRNAMIIFVAIAIKGVILAQWDAYKVRKANEPIPLELRNGMYVPWGLVQKVQHYGWRITQVWMVYMAVLLIALAYVKLIKPLL